MGTSITIPVNRPRFSGNEARYLQECIQSGWISSEGPFVERFEGAFAEATDRRYGISVANGSVALEVALAALEIGPGDEVLVPSFTIISCVAAIVRAGAQPKLVDSEPQTWNMDVQAAAAAVSARTKAIMVVHTYGLPVDVDPLLDLGRRRGIPVIEDAAQMHGQFYRDRPCGSLGDISTFSFYANKHVTTGEGGMVVTNDQRLADRARSFRNLCFQPERRFVHEDLGWNFRMTSLQAAVGLAQLEQLPESIRRKRAIGTAYRSKLSGIQVLSTTPHLVDYAENIYWVNGYLVAPDAPLTAHQLGKALAERGIGTRPFFWPMHEQPVFQSMGLFSGERYPVAEQLGRQGIYFPSGLGTTDEELERVTDAVAEVLE